MLKRSPFRRIPRHLPGILFWAAFLPVFAGYAEPLRVSMLSPEPPQSLFWGQTMEFAKAVAEDLNNVDLDIVYPPVTSDSSSYIIKRLGMKILNSQVKPDYLLTGYWGSAVDLFESAGKQHDIRIFMFNTDLTPEERSVIGKPRGKYPNWIGHMYPDDEQGGYELADILIGAAATQLNNTNPTIVALSGNTQSQVSMERLKGLQRRIDRDNDLSLKEVVSTTWTRESAIKATGEILDKHPETTIIWTVSNEIALGCLQVLEERGKHPGKDILVGSFDWSGEGLKAIKDGRMVASMGGHFMEAGWALIEIYDYQNGHDFKDDTGLVHITKMQPITKNNVDRFQQRLGDRDWRKIDFRKFSKTLNPALKKYDFTLDALLNTLN